MHIYILDSSAASELLLLLLLLAGLLFLIRGFIYLINFVNRIIRISKAHIIYN